LAPSFGGPPKRGLYEEWVRAGTWAKGQIDNSSFYQLLDPFQIFNYVLEMVFAKFYSSY